MRELKPRPYAHYLTVQEMEAVAKDGKLTKESHELLVGKFNSFVAKYNELLRIEQELGSRAQYAGLRWPLYGSARRPRRRLMQASR